MYCSVGGRKSEYNSGIVQRRLDCNGTGQAWGGQYENTGGFPLGVVLGGGGKVALGAGAGGVRVDRGRTVKRWGYIASIYLCCERGRIRYLVIIILILGRHDAV